MQGKTAEDAEKQVSRRTFLSYVNVAMGAFITAVLGIPLIGAAILPGLRKTQIDVASAGSVDEYQIGVPKAAVVTISIHDGWIQTREDKGIWVVRNSENDFTVYNGRCTHLGCAYNWLEAQKEFLCPCHGGRYTLDGRVVGGPPPRPLDTLGWRVEQGNLMVEYRDFLLGTAAKEAM